MATTFLGCRQSSSVESWFIRDFDHILTFLECLPGALLSVCRSW